MTNTLVATFVLAACIAPTPGSQSIGAAADRAAVQQAALDYVEGIDHLQLAKYSGRWQIINILWQAHPAK